MGLYGHEDFTVKCVEHINFVCMFDVHRTTKQKLEINTES